MIQPLSENWTREDFQSGSSLTVLQNDEKTGVVQPEAGEKRFQVSSVGLESEEPRNALARTAAWKPNTAYYVRFSTWGGKTSAGNYYFLDLHSAAGVSQVTVDLVGNDHNAMLPAKCTHSGKGLPIPDLPYGIVGITKDKKGRLGVGNGTLKGGKIDGTAFPVIGKGARQNLPAVIQGRMEEDVVNGVRISTFSAGVVSFRTMLEMAEITPVQKMSQSFSMEKPWRVFHQF